MLMMIKHKDLILGVSESLEAIREEIRSKHGVELDSRRDVVEIITKKNDRNHIMVKGSRTSVHDITDRILLRISEKAISSFT